ncbi:hypothetical protein [Polaromonas sp. CG_9.11]|uniref:hypothetical protein n=1 Tax=Polaromonas sp. CG_9.11 TaxID=2787730 RepID=UPI0018CBB90A|nr:hypothetical protein [Polaromonas sp. CG_9.11]MBG6077449.1 metallo-beta-lactamase family protein [Polaromonas sp. CG_9.11]
MRFHFMGGAGSVNGSKYLRRRGQPSDPADGGRRLDYKQLGVCNCAPLSIDPASIVAVILNHALIDHSGHLPLLARQGLQVKGAISAL